jgi:hypothetical protein
MICSILSCALRKRDAVNGTVRKTMKNYLAGMLTLLAVCIVLTSGRGLCAEATDRDSAPLMLEPYRVVEPRLLREWLGFDQKPTEWKGRAVISRLFVSHQIDKKSPCLRAGLRPGMEVWNVQGVHPSGLTFEEFSARVAAALEKDPVDEIRITVMEARRMPTIAIPLEEVRSFYRPNSPSGRPAGKFASYHLSEPIWKSPENIKYAFLYADSNLDVKTVGEYAGKLYAGQFSMRRASPAHLELFFANVTRSVTTDFERGRPEWKETWTRHVVAIGDSKVIDRNPSVPSAGKAKQERSSSHDFEWSKLPFLKTNNGPVLSVLYVNAKFDHKTVIQYLSNVSTTKIKNKAGEDIPSPFTYRLATDKEVEIFHKALGSKSSAFEQSNPEQAAKMMKYVVARTNNN